MRDATLVLSAEATQRVFDLSYVLWYVTEGSEDHGDFSFFGFVSGVGLLRAVDKASICRAESGPEVGGSIIPVPSESR
jgi:hypothetical protein